MRDQIKTYLMQMGARLLAITADSRDDMHEPDEQGLKARVIGDHLDNAMGEHIGERQIREGFQEFVVVLDRTNQTTGERTTESFNLATLIALARIGAKQVAGQT